MAKSCQMSWRIERNITKIKLLVENSAITEVNELKNIKFTFKIFRVQIFHIYNLKSKWQNYNHGQNI